MAGELLELMFENNRELRVKALTRVQVVISQSFRQDGSRITRDEVTRRFKLLEKWIRELRSESHGWTWERIFDALPQVLRHELDGVPWSPATHRSVWAPGDPLRV